MLRIAAQPRRNTTVSRALYCIYENVEACDSQPPSRYWTTLSLHRSRGLCSVQPYQQHAPANDQATLQGLARTSWTFRPVSSHLLIAASNAFCISLAFVPTSPSPIFPTFLGLASSHLIIFLYTTIYCRRGQQVFS